MLKIPNPMYIVIYELEKQLNLIYLIDLFQMQIIKK